MVLDGWCGGFVEGEGGGLEHFVFLFFWVCVGLETLRGVRWVGMGVKAFQGVGR